MLNKNVLNGQAVPGRLPTTAAQSHPDKRLAATPAAGGVSRALEPRAPQQCPGARCHPTQPSGAPSDTQPRSPRSGPALTHLQGERGLSEVSTQQKHCLAGSAQRPAWFSVNSFLSFCLSVFPAPEVSQRPSVMQPGRGTPRLPQAFGRAGGRRAG